jgi:anaerobic magnesium-protoporphyrin IX monomethyl ester cyclase
MRVCLIKVPSPFLVDEKVMPPLGLLAVGTGLKRRGHTVCIYDGPLSEIPQGYDMYGVGPTTPEYLYALEVLRDVNAPVMIGGPHASINPEACLDDGFKLVVVGDGEALDISRRGIVHIKEQPLDLYPVSDRNLLDIKSYRYFIDGRLATTVVTARGCPYQCAFCSKNYSTVRLKSAEDVIKEVHYLYCEFGYRAIMFFDDTFIIDSKRTLQIGEYLSRLGIIWRCFVRADLIVRYGREFANRLKGLGCVEVGMGIESGSDTILQNIHKGENVDTIKKAIEILHEAGIRVKGFFIIGLPGESPETIEETRRFVQEVKLEGKDFTIYQPYDGSPITKNKPGYDINWDSMPKHFKGKKFEYESVVYTSKLSQDDIVQARNNLESLCAN